MKKPEDLTPEEFKEITDQIFSGPKVKVVPTSNPNVHITEYKFGKDGHKDRVVSVLERIKNLPDWQLENFLVSLVKRSQEQMCFKDYPFPNNVAQKFICDHFEGGTP